MLGALPGMAFEQLRPQVELEREHQPIGLGEVERPLERAPGGLSLTKRVPGARLNQKGRYQPDLMRWRRGDG